MVVPLPHLVNCSQFTLWIHSYRTSDVVQAPQDKLFVVWILIGHVNRGTRGRGTSGSSNLVPIAALHRLSIVWNEELSVLCRIFLKIIQLLLTVTVLDSVHHVLLDKLRPLDEEDTSGTVQLPFR